jgi:hypothetical protein
MFWRRVAVFSGRCLSFFGTTRASNFRTRNRRLPCKPSPGSHPSIRGGRARQTPSCPTICHRQSTDPTAHQTNGPSSALITYAASTWGTPPASLAPNGGRVFNSFERAEMLPSDVRAPRERKHHRFTVKWSLYYFEKVNDTLITARQRVCSFELKDLWSFEPDTLYDSH